MERAFKNVIIAKDTTEITLAVSLILLLDKDGHLRNRDIDNVEMFNAFFISLFNTSDSL